MTSPNSICLDHVHVLVTDRDQAAEWCSRVLGLNRQSASEDPYGPLTVSGDGGKTCLALFTSRVNAEPNRVVAFRIDAQAFLGFAERLLELEVPAANRVRLRPEDFVDHGDVLSYYLVDPDGNGFELATYEVDAARIGIAELSVRSQLDL
jgi:catechol 2,3-dioxygenase-like lactoylglutathione lyase family enzyme